VKYPYSASEVRNYLAG